MPESLATEALIKFDYLSPDADVPWQIDDLGGGVFARYRRTIAQKSRVITGTGGCRARVRPRRCAGRPRHRRTRAGGT